MQTKLAKLLFLIVVLSISIQTSRVEAETGTGIHILNVTPTVGSVPANYYPERGKEMGVNVTLANPQASNVTINLHITVFDCERVPVGYVSVNDYNLTSGTSILHAEVKVAAFAYVGIANIEVEVEYGNVPYASSTQQVYIQPEWIKADFNRDGHIDASDVALLIDAYANSWKGISANLTYDLNCDGKIDALDIAYFVDAYQAYNHK